MTAKLLIVLLIAGCSSPQLTLMEELKEDTARKYREACMNSAGNIDPVLRVQILQNCNAWARRKAGL